jgi:hypothetical protein
MHAKCSNLRVYMFHIDKLEHFGTFWFIINITRGFYFHEFVACSSIHLTSIHQHIKQKPKNFGKPTKCMSINMYTDKLEHFG